MNNNDTDAEGDLLTYSRVAGPNHGSLTLNSDGSFTYTHDGSETVSDSFTYRVSDGNGGLDESVVNLTIAPVNDAPVVAGESFVLNEGGTMVLPQPGLLSNDTDAESTVLTTSLGDGSDQRTVVVER